MAKKVLVADDSRMIRGVIQFILDKRGCDVTLCDNGTSAIEAANKEAFDLMFVDYNMPGADGVDVVREARQSRGNAQTPIYIVTTEKTDDKKALARSAGANGWVHKPVKEEIVEKICRKHLG